MEQPMNPGVIQTIKMECPSTDGPLIRPAAEAVGPVEPEDLSRFEGEGGPEAPVPAAELIEVPIENAIWQKPRGTAHQSNQAKMTVSNGPTENQ
jgi:hypothetical protein